MSITNQVLSAAHECCKERRKNTHLKFPPARTLSVATLIERPRMHSLSLGNDLGIEACADLKQQLDECLHHPALLCLDGSAATRVHTASLQLLCALFRSRKDAGRDTGWVAASPVLHEAARLLGLTAVLGLADVQHPSTSPQTEDHDMEIAA